jgi:hypothetical protein
MVARWGDDHPEVPLIVVLHGNGTSEQLAVAMRYCWRCAASAPVTSALVSYQ